MSSRLVVLLMTYGSPADDLHDLPEYLAAVRGIIGQLARAGEAA